VNAGLVWALIALAFATLLVAAWTALALGRLRAGGAQAGLDAQLQRKELQDLRALLQSSNERLERELRREIAESSQGARRELTQNLATFQQTLTQQNAEATRTQNTQIDAFGQQLSLLQKTLADTLHTQLSGMGESTARRLAELSDTNTRSMTAVRDALNQQLAQLQTTNSAKLDEMRATVDEKLQTTLQARLGESFKQVADRLEQVHKGLGEMQTLAQGVGDLKHLLTNVKTRGIFGEAQLAGLLEQVFVPDQYAVQIATRPGSKNVVDFAIKLPGKSDTGAPLWLPIDAKFPNEDYERLLDAQGRADVLGAEAAGKALELRIRLEAKSMVEKYVEPPFTTDFAILFLPTEGLYAEVLRRPGLMESLQRDHRVTLAGPTTLLAMLSSLQMGFRTLALEKRSSEVWQVLGAVKTEFGKFGDVLAKVKSQTETVLKTLDSAETRSRAMSRVLKKVDALPDTQAQALIPVEKDFDRADGDTDVDTST
jgi:DNA recombination protein RmuC